MLKITLTQGKVGKKDTQKRVLLALGLGKYGSSVVHADTPTIRGMIDKVSHLVKVEEVPNGTPTGRVTRRAKRQSQHKEVHATTRTTAKSGGEKAGTASKSTAKTAAGVGAAAE